jgi:acetolactate synthase-1/3 small subunit
MTIAAQGSPEGLDQVIRQLSKLIDVIRCVEHTGEDSVVKEMALIKVGVGENDRTGALQVADHFGAKTVDLTDRSMVVLATGNSDKLDALIRLLSKYTIIELVRTGKVVMARGDAAT